MKYAIAIFIAIMFFSCNDTNKTSFSMNEPSLPLKDLKDKVTKQGDKDAYEELSKAYMNLPIGELLPYSLVMANKYNNAQASFDVYESIVLMQCPSQDSLECLDSKSLNMALEYLKLSANQGLSVAKKILGEFYIEGVYLPKDTVMGNKLLKDSL